MKDNSKKMLATAVFMAAATALSKVLGLLRDSMIAAFFATGMKADAFMAASKLPTTLFDMVIGGVISATFIPVFNSIMTKGSKKEAMEFLNKFVTLIIVLTSLISVFGILFADPLVNLLAPNYTGDKHNLTVQLTSIMFPMIIFTGLTFSYVGFLQSMGEFNIPSIISLVYNIAIIVYFLIFGKKFDIQGLAVTMVVAWSLQVIIQIPSLIKFKYKFKLDFKFADKNIKSAIMLAGPMLISTWVQPLYTVINSRLASGIDGAYSALEYANRLYLIITGVFSFVVTNLIFPKLSIANASNDSESAVALIVSSIKAIIIVILPLMTGFIILSAPITSVIYQHGEFKAEQVPVVSNALACYSIGMLGLAINEILSKYFFSMQDSKTPMRNSILSMVFNIIMAYVLFGLLKINGLALAAAGGSIFNAILNAICISKRRPGIIKKPDIITILKVVISSAVMGTAVFIIYKFTGRYFDGFMGNIILCVICGVSGIIVYGACLMISGVDEVKSLLRKQ